MMTAREVIIAYIAREHGRLIALRQVEMTLLENGDLEAAAFAADMQDAIEARVKRLEHRWGV